MTPSDDGTPTKEHKPLTFGAGLLGYTALLTIWFFLLYPLVKGQFSQSDTFWLIEIGRSIIEHHALPAHDLYSFTTQAAPLIPYQWLAEVIFSLASAAAGLTGVAVLGQALLAMLFCVLIFRRLIGSGAYAIISAAVIALAVYSVYPDISALRPQLFSFLLFWLLTAICADGATACVDASTNLPLRKSVLATFVIAILWTNCHVSFPIGMAIIAIHLASSLLLFVRKSADKQLPILFGSMLMAFLLATLLTPQGFSLWSFVGSIHGMYFTQEVRPLDWSNKPLLIFLAACVFASLVYLRRKMDPATVLVPIALLAAGCMYSRLIIYFSIASIPIISQAASQIFATRLQRPTLDQLDAALKAVAHNVCYPFTVLALSLLTVVVQPLYIPRSIPLQAAEFISSHPIAGHLFSTAHAGSYLIYRFRGAVPVFIDTRIDLYDVDFCSRFLAAVQRGADWEKLFAQYQIRAALLPNDSALQLLLQQQPNWRLIYRDNDFSLYAQK